MTEPTKSTNPITDHDPICWNCKGRLSSHRWSPLGLKCGGDTHFPPVDLWRMVNRFEFYEIYDLKLGRRVGMISRTYVENHPDIHMALPFALRPMCDLWEWEPTHLFATMAE